MHSGFLSAVPAFAGLVLASPFPPANTAPVATVANGTVIGSTANGVDSFRGIPFAAPPVGPLRFKAPQPYNQQYPGGTLSATNMPRACAQFMGPFNQIELDVLATAANTIGQTLNIPFAHIPTDAGEDCLTLNVQRPAGTTKDSKLPVVLWIFGGGFEFGSTQSYDGSKFIQQGMTGLAAGHPVIMVAINYRLGGFGFLGGKELKADGSTNLGLRDQRLAFQWVADNIAAFGGDPDRVTIWGQSAGSISVFDHLMVNGGDHTYKGKPLFQGAIMSSGSAIATQPVDCEKAQVVYDAVVLKAGCFGAKDTLACLRSVDYDILLAATNSVNAFLSYTSVDLSYLPRPDNSDNFFTTSADLSAAAGKYAKVPMIMGTVEDEGTLLALFQPNITTTDDIVTYLTTYFPPDAPVSALVATYSDNIMEGSPYNTGIFNNIYPQFKRLGSIIGDVVFSLTRRSMLRIMSPAVPTWSYLDSHLSLLPVLGTFHTSDVISAFDAVPLSTAAATFQTHFTSFAYYQDPNRIGQAGPLVDWPKWSNDNPQMLHLHLFHNDVTSDDFRMDQWNVLKDSYWKMAIR